MWSFLWRGAVGGVLGVFVFVGYAVYRSPISILGLGELPTFLLIGGLSGVLVGAMISFSGRLVRRRLRITYRMILGTIVTSVLIAFYLYLTEGLGDLERFISNSLVLGLTVGGLAAAVARGKKPSKRS